MSRTPYYFTMRAFIITEDNDVLTCGVKDVDPAATDENDVLVHVDFSGINFKDAMVALPKSRVRRVASLVGGVDAAGSIVKSTNENFPVGTRVAVHGGNMGVGRDGGFAEYVYAPARYLSALPASISTHDAMVIGTAGFTAMQSVLALEDHGMQLDDEILVSGATGGVGSMSVTFLAIRGYRPVASTGSIDQSQWLTARGAAQVIGRTDVSDQPSRVLGTERWDGAIDCVGGETLAQILRSLRYGGAVAACGLVASAELVTTVYPFITRNVALLGIDCVEATSATRIRVWNALGATATAIDFEPLIDRVVQLAELPEALDDIRRGRTRGRILVIPTPG
jgi:acrylyl-CoA reductase (NADPH)